MGKQIAIITINKPGERLARRLKGHFTHARVFNAHKRRNCQLSALVESIFGRYDGLIFIAAAGITVRLVGRIAQSKLSDPAVVSVDAAARFAISLLSGHEGGANNLAYLVAGYLDAIPVVTTAGEAHKKFVIGIGARRGVKASQVKRAVRHILKQKKIRIEDVRLAATIDLKKNEKGLLNACADMGLPLAFIPRESIRNFKSGTSGSEAARRHLGVDGVCEPCALLAGRRTRLIAGKQILGPVTVAIAGEG